MMTTDVKKTQKEWSRDGMSSGVVAARLNLRDPSQTSASISHYSPWTYQAQLERPHPSRPDLDLCVLFGILTDGYIYFHAIPPTFALSLA